jgi:hypothetical protein
MIINDKICVSFYSFVNLLPTTTAKASKPTLLVCDPDQKIVDCGSKFVAPHKNGHHAPSQADSATVSGANQIPGRSVPHERAPDGEQRF